MYIIAAINLLGVAVMLGNGNYLGAMWALTATFWAILYFTKKADQCK